MRFNRKTYFAENGDPTVPGFTIIECGDGQYRIAEKWYRNNGSTWVTYWIEDTELHERVDRDVCEPKGQVSDEQFEKICERADPRALEQ